MPQLHVGKIGRDPSSDAPPQSRAAEHVRLVYGSDQVATTARQLEGMSHNAIDLLLAVHHGIDGRSPLLLLANFAWFAVVESTSKLANDQQIYPPYDVALE